MKRFTSVLCLLALAGSASAQDSVSLTPGAGDAIDAWTSPFVRHYVVDLVPLTSSWGNTFFIGPVLKAHADPDPMFSTMILGSAAMSADQLASVAFDPTDFSLWTTPGAGVNASANSAPGALNISGYDRRFALGFSDFSAATSFAAGALIGQNAAEPSRLYVTRTLAAAGAQNDASANTSTVALGGIDASGHIHLRADDFNSSGSTKLVGENIVTIDLSGINALNRLIFLAGTNRGTVNAATTFVVNADTVTTNTPSAIPASIAGTRFPLALNFTGQYRANGAAGVTTHLDPALAAHRGNPSFAAIDALGGVGIMASLARSSPVATSFTDSINLAALSAAGAPVATRAASLPLSLSDGSATFNTSGEAQFLQYFSQTSFRGGNGQVGVGFDPATGETLAAATASDPANGEFIALARFPAMGSPSWDLVAYAGKPVLSGPGGSTIGTVIAAPPATLSAPAIDRFGNVYFVAAYEPAGGPAGKAFIKAVNTGAGYELEALLRTGDAFNGANSGRTYAVTDLTLADSDSIASGAFFSANLLQPLDPGASPSGPADPFAFGGAAVNATITYDNGGTPEAYQAVLFIAPGAQPGFTCCPGNANGDSTVDFNDITAVLANWLATGVSPNTNGDANCDGDVNFNDITTILANWLANCP